jgi:RNA polymerase-binding protein DksA
MDDKGADWLMATTNAQKKKLEKKLTKKPAASPPAAKVSPAAKRPAASSAEKLSSRDKEEIRALLLKIREAVSGQISGLTDEARTERHTASTEEDGTDEFDREFALQLASTKQDSLFEIDEALQRIEKGTYGVCEHCGGHIGKARIKALPFVRMCVQCQSEVETRHAALRRNTERESRFGSAVEPN